MKETLSFGGHNFEIQIQHTTDASGGAKGKILFFELPKKPARGPRGEILHSHVPLGSVSFVVPRTQDIMMINGGGFTFKPERYGLTRSNVLALEARMFAKASKLVEKHFSHISPKRIVGQFIDAGNPIRQIDVQHLLLRKRELKQRTGTRKPAHHLPKPAGHRPRG